MRRPCRRTLAGLALIAVASGLVAGRATAQSRERPQLIIGMTGGYVTGPRLWKLDRQLVPVDWSGALDSVTLQRLFRTGYVAGVGATLYRSPRVGYTMEIAFLGLPTESRCAPLGPYADDSAHLNEQTCLFIQGRGITTSAATFQAGVTLRAQPNATVQPYLRGMAGVAVLGGSFVTTQGFAVRDSSILTRNLLDDPKPRDLTWVVTLASGVSLKINEGYLLRFEVRDVILDLPVVTGPAAVTPGPRYAQVGSRTVHLPAFTVSLDLVLEPLRHPRRY